MIRFELSATHKAIDGFKSHLRQIRVKLSATYKSTLTYGLRPSMFAGVALLFLVVRPKVTKYLYEHYEPGWKKIIGKHQVFGSIKSRLQVQVSVLLNIYSTRFSVLQESFFWHSTKTFLTFTILVSKFS